MSFPYKAIQESRRTRGCCTIALLIVQHPIAKEQHEFLAVAYEKSENLKKLIEELFQYTKLSNNYVKLDKVLFNIAVLVNQIVGEHVLFLSEKNIKVEIEGSGLGLAISKKIIELHSGKIWVECNGNIIKFNIELPKVLDACSITGCNEIK